MHVVRGSAAYQVTARMFGRVRCVLIFQLRQFFRGTSNGSTRKIGRPFGRVDREERDLDTVPAIGLVTNAPKGDVVPEL